MSNQDLIDRGAPRSLFLPGNQYWRGNRRFTARSTIFNADQVTTNPSGSSITLNASQESMLEAGITFAARRVQMSSRNDSIRAQARTGLNLSNSGLEIEGRGDSYLSQTPASLIMGDGRNSIAIGGGRNNWQIGMRIGTGALLSAGTGRDTFRAIGTDVGIRVVGRIESGGGNDSLTGRSLSGDSAIHVDNPGTIDMGPGNDRLIGRGGSRPIYINGNVVMGAGRDVITGRSLHVNSSSIATIDMGAGNDSILSPLVSANGARLDFGSGTDRLVVRPGTYNAQTMENGSIMLSGNGISDAVITGLEFLVSSTTGVETRFADGALNIL